MPMIPEEIRARFWKNVSPAENDHGCWEWTGSRQPAGYGQMSASSLFTFPEKTHRIAYWMAFGPDSIPEGCLIRHKVCNNPPCVRVSHLRVGTQQQNMRDMVEAGRDNPWNRDKERCKRGHRLPDKPNAVDGRGRPYRGCLRCREITNAAHLVRVAKSHCKRGHPMRDDIRDSSGRRYCKECRCGSRW